MLKVVQREVPDLGHVYAPRGPGPFPAVMLLHGSEGARGWLAHRDAALFAAHGFVAYPHPYSRDDTPWTGGDIWRADLALTERALAVLRASDLCSGKVGVYGWSRGAEHALLSTAMMATRASPDLPDAVAAHAAPNRVMGAWRNTFVRGADLTGDRSGEGSPLWAWDATQYDPILPAWTWAGKAIAPGGLIEIERYGGPLHLSVGDQDEIWPWTMTTKLVDRLRQAGRAPEVQVYAGQPHMPDPAGWDRHLNNLLEFFSRHLGS